MFKVLRTIIKGTPESPDFNGLPNNIISALQAAIDAGNYEIIPDPEPVPEVITPNWDGLYTSLMVSDIYSGLVSLGLQISQVSLTLAAAIDAIQYGIFKPDSEAALPAFQSSVNLLLSILTNVGQPLSSEQLAEVRSILDANGFETITLGG